MIIGLTYSWERLRLHNKWLQSPLSPVQIQIRRNVAKRFFQGSCKISSMLKHADH